MNKLLDSAYKWFPEKPSPIISIGQESEAVTHKNFLRRLGQTIREARRQKRMTQERLSEIAGISAKYLSEVERGRSNVTVLFLLRLSKALKLDLGDLLWGCEDGSDAFRIRREIWDELQGLRAEEAKKAARILRAIAETDDKNGAEESTIKRRNRYRRRCIVVQLIQLERDCAVGDEHGRSLDNS